MRFHAGLLVLAAMSPFAIAGGDLKKDIATIVNQGRGTPAGQAAWARVSQAGSDALPLLLDGMNTKDTVVANWLRTACDQIIDRERKAGKQLDQVKLADFVKNPNNHGRARRYALEVLETVKPGWRDSLMSGWLDDPEFRYEAVAQVLDKARKASNAVNLFRLAFDKSRDVQQARDAAAGLEAGGIKVSVAEHLGFFTEWHLIGPFDGRNQKGLITEYPPEKKVDLKAELDGKSGKVRWIEYRVKEPPHTSNARHQALVDLREKRALGDADDAVAFAYAEFTVEKAIKAELRGAADDNFAVWLNGAKVFSFEEWRNGVRHDRHRIPVELKAGRNAVLVKISQSSAPNPEPNWEFFLRLVDETGKGIAFKK
jgi:hypothetical protein